MSRLTSWWDALPGPAKFRLYTRGTLQAGLVAVIIVMAFPAHAPWSTAGIAVAGLGAILAIEAQPAFAVSSKSTPRRWGLPVGAATLAAVWLTGAVVARLAADETTTKAAYFVSICAAALAMYSVVSFLPHRWWAVLGLSVATGLALGSSLTSGLVAGFVTLLAGGLVVATTLLTVWGMRVVEELDRAKAIEAELQVAEERLRFARDLHDIVGRGFSAIAVKSELAAVLSRSGAADRAAAEMDEVKTLAVDSMGQMRELVRGYRGIDLSAEVAGARSLLSAVGCRLVVEGDPAKIPARCHEVAAWVVREGTTNIVEHSAATSATLTLGDAGMSLRNDAPHGAPGERSGLRGLAERLAAIGATLDITAETDQFVLEIHWENP
ncbi:two-component system sensor histidine kinase DesK [Nocardia tenerifensis]|uniref:Two-component system sensor histidine kinase DesK n=1 Tax=Nocardia tenerifensis TaxID=228006 RepID=A0A318KBN7_9NOCA|nr:histidine kinase [Nocardia tenerifensis]PXX71297.1 two-component system sensor histidine kinase DesK [Nocardia tenerifensis]